MANGGRRQCCEQMEARMKIGGVTIALWLFIGLVLLPWPYAAWAQQRPGIRPFVKPPEDCYLLDPAEPENPYAFLRAEIQTLSLAQRGEQANARMLKTPGGASLDDMDKAINGLREERIENTCASFVISYYNHSKDPAIAAIAGDLISSYNALGKMSDELLGIHLQKTIRKINGPSPQKQFADLMAKRQALLRSVANQINLSLGMLVDDNRANEQGEFDHLILRKVEIRNLTNYLYTQFPSLKDSPRTLPSGDFGRLAANIRDFLARGFKPADSP